MHRHYPNTPNQHRVDYAYANHPNNVQSSISHQEVDVKPVVYPPPATMMASASTSSQTYSAAAEDARTRNARAQARHRAKRKAYIAHLEASLASLQATLAASSPSARLQQLQDENIKLREEAEMLRAQLKVATDEGRRYSTHYSGDEAREGNRTSSEDSGTLFNNPPISRTVHSHLQHVASPYGNTPPHDTSPVSGYSQDWGRHRSAAPLPSVPYRNTTGYLPPVQNPPASQHQNEQYYFGQSNTPSPNPSDEGAGPSDSFGRRLGEGSGVGYASGMGYIPASSSQYQNVVPHYSSSSSGPIMQRSGHAPSGAGSPIDGRRPPFSDKGAQGWPSDRQ